MLRFGLWLVLNYRYGLPFWFAVAASFVVLNVTLFKWYYQLRDFAASTAFTQLMSNETSRKEILNVMKWWQLLIVIACLYLFPTSYIGVWRSLQLNELEGPVWLQYYFLLSYPYVFYAGFWPWRALSIGIAFGTNRLVRDIVQTCLGI